MVFIDWFLPGDKAGGPIRSCANLIDHLGKEFDFSVITRNTDYTSETPYDSVTSDAWNILPDGKRVYYISAAQLTRPVIEKLLHEETYDAVYLNGIWSQPFTAWPLRVLKKMNSPAKVVVAVRGMLAPSALAIKAPKKRAFLAYAKLWGIFSNAVFHATSETEAAETRAVFGDKNEVIIAGNFPRMQKTHPAAHVRKSERLRLVNVARIAPEKNTLGALEILSKVTVPLDADFFGAVYDPAYWKQCEKVLAAMPANVKVKFYPPADSAKIPELLSGYDFLFLPTRGENFGHIILEALQAGLPVLISDKTPWRNLESRHAGWDLPFSEQNRFVSVISILSEMDNATYGKWSQAALALAENYAAESGLLEANRRLFR